MTDDFVTDGILPEDVIAGDGEFDPNEFESDDILDDVDGEVEDLPLDLAADGLLGDDDDDDPIEERE